MSLNNSELLIAKLERVIQTSLAQLNVESVIVEREVCNLFNSIEAVLAQKRVLEKKRLPSIETFIRYVPLAIANLV